MSVTISEVSKVLTINLSFFPNVEIGEELVKAWHCHFKACSLTEFASAFHIAVDQNKTGFPPVPGQVWDVIRKLRATKESLESVDQAWVSAWESDYSSKSERTRAAIRLMPDWANRGYWQESSLPWKKKEFERIYNDLKERDEILETQNIARSSLGYGREELSEAQKRIMGALGL